MARQCSVCGKGAQLGNQVTTRGKQKYLGGVGTKVTGISRRKFKPNLQRVNISTADRHPQGGAGVRAVHPQRRSDQGRPGGTVQSAARPGEGEVALYSRPILGRRFHICLASRPKVAGIEQRRTGTARVSQRRARMAQLYIRSMSISRQDIEKVALLARLRLTEDELATMTSELAQIVGYVDQLAEVDTDGIEPMAHAIEIANVFRADVVTPSLRARRLCQRAAPRRARLSGARGAGRMTRKLSERLSHGFAERSGGRVKQSTVCDRIFSPTLSTHVAFRANRQRASARSSNRVRLRRSS